MKVDSVRMRKSLVNAWRRAGARRGRTGSIRNTEQKLQRGPRCLQSCALQSGPRCQLVAPAAVRRAALQILLQSGCTANCPVDAEILRAWQDSEREKLAESLLQTAERVGCKSRWSAAPCAAGLHSRWAPAAFLVKPCAWPEGDC